MQARPQARTRLSGFWLCPRPLDAGPPRRRDFLAFAHKPSLSLHRSILDARLDVHFYNIRIVGPECSHERRDQADIRHCGARRRGIVSRVGNTPRHEVDARRGHSPTFTDLGASRRISRELWAWSARGAAHHVPKDDRVDFLSPMDDLSSEASVQTRTSVPARLTIASTLRTPR